MLKRMQKQDIKSINLLSN